MQNKPSQLAVSRSSQMKKKLEVDDLMPQTVDFQRMQKNLKAYNGSGTDSTAPDNSSDDWGAGGHQFGRLQDYGALKRVSERIDRLVQYPKVLSTRKIGGFVKARLVLKKDGACDWRTSTIGGTRHELRVYVLMLLKDYCLKGPGRFARESNTVDFAFQFDVYSKEKAPTLINGNVVLVHLPGHQDRGSWKLGPLQGHALFPTMVFLNPQWIRENWNRLVGKKEALEELKQEFNAPNL